MPDAIDINQSNGSPIVRQATQLADGEDPPASLSPLLRRLIEVAQADNRRVAELCDAVLRLDWDAATKAAKILSLKLDASPRTSLPSTQLHSSANTQNCA